ncbi:hypothetical protein [Clostridium magnum]|uniref:Uncharacterized protein n=1 Tax=Clostridium magnum DSM 2767 TaxID=1121326 RepID=A0A162TPE1_9CLOT|nr:hypothetical protein [Clostridium magnum]KZL92883.1 hypothetical protein CLMAG_26970 [Clostridium magnum DSM 2767]SHI28144.1 hypothetical protein SAMN02745944_03948 [Clostridium magnum DSM 2767]
MRKIIQLDEYRKKREKDTSKFNFEDAVDNFVGFEIDDEELERILKESNDDTPLSF